MAKELPRFKIYISIGGRSPVLAGQAATLESAIKQCERAIETSLEVYAGGYGQDPRRDVWSVYDEKTALTRWTSNRR